MDIDKSLPSTPTSTTTASDQAQSDGEKPTFGTKAALKVLKRSLIHIIPVAATVTLVGLSAKTVYWTDLNAFAWQAAALQLFQFGIKAHEVFLTISIADVVLHYISRDLLVAGGVPFGFLAAEYQLSQVEYFISRHFWGAARTQWASNTSFRRVSLSAAIAAGFALTMLSAPASGVLMIPKLGWWPVKDPFSGTKLKLFFSNAPNQALWSNSLGWYNCSGSDWTCPNAGSLDFLAWAGGLTWNNVAPEVPFITGGDNFYRYVVSNTTNSTSGWTVTTSPMMRVATTLGSYWNWIAWQNLAPAAKLMQPKLSLSFADKSPVYQPLIQVQCSSYDMSAGVADMMLPNDQLRHGFRGSTYFDESWPIPQNYSSVDPTQQRHHYDLYWTKLPTEGYQTSPSTGLIFIMLDEHYNRIAVPCSVLAHWVPSEIYITPEADRNIHSHLSNPLDFLNRSRITLSASTKISFSDRWWNELLEGAHPSTMDMVLHGIYGQKCESCPYVYYAGSQGLAYRVSTVVGMYLTDAIARYTPDPLSVVFDYTGKISEGVAHSVNQFETSPIPAPPGYSSWLQRARDAPDKWREAKVKISRYGYAWSFDGVLVKIAAIALMAHVFLASVHVFLLIVVRSWTSGAWSSLDGLIALALRSGNSGTPVGGEYGSEKKAPIVSLRSDGQTLELVYGAAPKSHSPGAV